GAGGSMIKSKHAFFGERRDELNGEKRTASRLLMNQLRERPATVGCAAKCVRKQLTQVLQGERGKRDLLYLSASALDRLELPLQWMGGIDFVVAISAYQHEVLQIRARHQIFQ